MDYLEKVPSLPQSQASVSDQLAAVVGIANRMGLHDAADAIKQLSKKVSELKYGCHVDLEEGEGPDGCVIDEGAYSDCICAKVDMRKEQCEYWRIIAKPPTGPKG